MAREAFDVRIEIDAGTLGKLDTTLTGRGTGIHFLLAMKQMPLESRRLIHRNAGRKLHR